MQAEWIGRWCEGCACHEDILLAWASEQASTVNHHSFVRLNSYFLSISASFLFLILRALAALGVASLNFDQADLRLQCHEHGCRRRASSLLPGELQAAMKCPLRCCRAPEMACGDALAKLNLRMSLLCMQSI